MQPAVSAREQESPWPPRDPTGASGREDFRLHAGEHGGIRDPEYPRPQWGPSPRFTHRPAASTSPFGSRQGETLTRVHCSRSGMRIGVHCWDDRSIRSYRSEVAVPRKGVVQRWLDRASVQGRI